MVGTLALQGLQRMLVERTTAIGKPPGLILLD
jgi:hypothetical protein